VKEAVNFYVNTIKESGELGASSTGFQECANLFGQGQTAMWYDATSAVSTLEDPKTYPDLVGKIGYLPAPIVEKPNSGWLYTWALGIPKGAKNPDGAWKFISWMTSKDYMKLVGEKLGWERVPPGTARVRGRFEVLRPPDPQVDHQCHPGQADGATGAVHGRAVRRHPRVPGSRNTGEPADQRGDSRPDHGGRSAGASTAICRGRRQDLPGEVMTLTADTDADAGEKAVAERVRKIRAAQETGVSRAEGWRRRGPLLPALIFMIAVTQLPFLFTLYYSTLSWNLVRPGSRQFVGINNYIAVVKDSQFWSVALNTVILIVGVVLISALLGLLLALLLDRAFLGRGIVRTLLITPFLITPVAGALIWKTTILDPTNGILNWVLSLVGIGPVDWIGQFPLTMVMVELIWQWTPFMMLLILAGLTSMPRDQLEAGRVDGAGAFQLFRELTLPHLRRFIELGVVLGAVYLVNTFDAIFMMTQGGPGVASANLPFYIYQRAFLGFDMGQAAAMGVVVVIFTMIIASFALRLIFKSFSGKEEAA
jgi:sorbitol/mannitol transport system permease protein